VFSKRVDQFGRSAINQFADFMLIVDTHRA